MPPPLDLTGRRFGKLTVIAAGARVKWGKQQRSWVCRCDCGAELVVPQNRLPHRPSIPPSHRVESCEDCRAIPCIICGGPVPPKANSTVCSDACRTQYVREYQRLYVARRRATDAAFDERLRHRSRERYQALDPDARAEQNRAKYARDQKRLGRDEINALARKSYGARMLDDRFRERARQRQRAWRDRRPESVRLSMRAYYARHADDPEFMARRAEDRRRWYARVKNSPALWQQIRLRRISERGAQRLNKLRRLIDDANRDD